MTKRAVKMMVMTNMVFVFLLVPIYSLLNLSYLALKNIMTLLRIDALFTKLIPGLNFLIGFDT